MVLPSIVSNSYTYCIKVSNRGIHSNLRNFDEENKSDYVEFFRLPTHYYSFYVNYCANMI